MFGLLLAVGVSLLLPVIALTLAWRRRKLIPFLLGASAFTVSQVLIRIPILQYLSRHSTDYSLLQAMQPVLFMILLGLSAGIAEESARYIAMRFLIKEQDWQSGFFFGLGHGGTEAVLFLGIPAAGLLFSPEASAYGNAFLVGSIERFFAIMLHVGLSLLVLRSVAEKKFRYTVGAVLIHSLIDAFVGLIPLWMPAELSVFTIEAALAVLALSVFGYGIRMKQKGVLS